MPTSALALAGVITIRPAEGAEATSRADVERSATIVPLLTLADRQPSAYRPGKYPARLMALAITAAIHVVVVAVLVYEWRKPEPSTPSERVIVMTLLAPAPDRPAKRPERGTAAKKATEPALAELTAPIVNLPQQPATITVAEPSVQANAPDDGGKADQLADVAQTYRRAIIAQLDAERRYPRAALLDGYQGAGAILFHIDRDGRLIDVAIEASTGRRVLDRAAMALVQRAAPFPAIPDQMPDRLEVSLPIRFLIVESATMMAAR